MIVKPPSTLLMGPTGSGKTTALTTYIEAGLTLVVVVTEPGGEESLIDAITTAKLPMDRLHYAYVPFASTSWGALNQLVTRVGSGSYEDLTRSKSGIAKTEYRQMLNLTATLADFTCQRTGKNLGPIDDLPPTYAFAIDSLTGLNQMCRDLMVGAKPTIAQGEWGTIMNVETTFINKLTSDLKCFFALTAHVNKTFNETTGRTLVTPQFVTKSLSDSLPRMFSDVVLQKREGTNFSWTVVETGADTKFRNLPPSAKLAPSFVPIVERYHARLAEANAA